MDIANNLNLDGVLARTDLPDELRPLVEDLVSRLQSRLTNLIVQLNAHPTVYYADPVANPNAVVGAKAGDVAVWIDNTGTSQFQVLTGE